MLLLSACPVKLVPSYDEKLLNDTEIFYKKGCELIQQGQAASPSTDSERSAIVNFDQHPAYFSRFESKYDALIIDCDALILRAMSSSETIDSAGKAIQSKITALIEASVSTSCPDLKSQFAEISLTAANFVDLKCLVLRWKEQHKKDGILKKANWESRKLMLFDVAFAIEKAESFKKEKRNQ
jgi:hypothetical protein